MHEANDTTSRYSPRPFPRPDADPARGHCGVRCFECLNAEADRDAQGWVTVGVILLGFAAMLVVGILIGNGTVAGWMR